MWISVRYQQQTYQKASKKGKTLQPTENHKNTEYRNANQMVPGFYI